MVGYSRLMEADERGTVARQKIHRAELIDPKIAKHHGRIVKTTGDGLLVEFASVVDAIECAVAVQQAMAIREQDVPEGRRIQFRVGINLGDIIIDGDDIFGDGVNIAARLEGLAEPGGICISRAARDQVRDKLDYPLEDMGEIEVKNIARPVRVFRVAANGKTTTGKKASGAGLRWAIAACVLVALSGAAAAWYFHQYGSDATPNGVASEEALPLPDKPSIAVLPFTNMSDDPKQEYFSDGITEDIITDLSKVSGLFVVARNSTFTYKGKAVKVREVGRALGVRHVLEGSIRKAGGRVRITAQLIDATTGNHVWAERYDRDLTNIFAVQDEVTKEIVTVLEVKLSVGEQARLHRTTRVDPDAYDMLLHGLERLRRYSREANEEAREYFEKAVAIDPSYGRAYADISYTHVLDVFNGYAEDRKKSIELAEAAIETAARLDDSLPIIHFTRSLLFRIRRQHDQSLAAILKAIQLDPNDDDGFVSKSITLVYVGRAEEGLESIQTAMRLNPHSSFFSFWALGLSYFHLERYEEAAIAFEKVVERNQHFLRGRLLLAATYGQMGRIEDAEWEAEEALALLPGMTISQRRAITPYKREAEINRYLEGLRKAGLPE